MQEDPLNFLMDVAAYLDFSVEVVYEYTQGLMACTIMSGNTIVNDSSSKMSVAVLNCVIRLGQKLFPELIHMWISSETNGLNGDLLSSKAMDAHLDEARPGLFSEWLASKDRDN